MKLASLHNVKAFFSGNNNQYELEHRCYNSVCFIAGIGCLASSLFNIWIGMPFFLSMFMGVTGSVYLWLFYRSYKSSDYHPFMTVYIMSGSGLLIVTWFFNGGMDGSGTFVSMVALVAMVAVLKKHRLLLTCCLFCPLVCTLFLIEYFYPHLIRSYSNMGQRFIDVFLSFLLCTAMIYIMVDIILKNYDRERRDLKKANRLINEKMQQLDKSNEDLQDALSQIKTLAGLLPICSQCKKIRDDRGYWNQIESYIQKHSNAEFSHGICPECSEKLYGKEDWFIEMKEKQNSKK